MVGLTKFRTFIIERREERELEEINDEYYNEITDNRNRLNEQLEQTQTNNLPQQPPYSYQGEIGEDGWEVCEYPQNSGIWWWKDNENSTWVLWE